MVEAAVRIMSFEFPWMPPFIAGGYSGGPGWRQPNGGGGSTGGRDEVGGSTADQAELDPWWAAGGGGARRRPSRGREE